MAVETTNELIAVNSMLATIGEAPLNTLDNLSLVDGITALQTLREVSREVQVEGYTFNTDEGYPLTPQGFAPFEVLVPNNAIEIDLDNNDYVVRGTRVYDRKRFSYNFQDVGTITAKVIWLLEFPDIPEVTRQYVAIRAARRFQKRVVGAEVLHAITDDDERMARWNHRRASTRIKKKNFLMDSETSARIAGQRYSAVI
jgi:hypothetical protein